MQAMTISQHRFPRLTKIAALSMLAFALAAGNAPAEQATGTQTVAAHLASVGLADLEDAFWVCDYAATTRGAAGSEITLCTAVYDALKARKFGGDFDKLLDWWRTHKVARHDALAADSTSESR